MAAGDPGSPARYYSSTAIETALQSAIGPQSSGQANTAFIVGSVSGFPTSYPYTLIVDPDTSKEEVLTVYAGAGTTLSVYRGADGTAGVAHSAGAVVRHGVSGRDFRESETHIAARGYDIDQTILNLANQTHVHGIQTGDGVVVGTDSIQTLTRKTLTSPTITNPSISGAGVDASIVFEGTTADAYETTLTVVDPTQDNTITLPNTTGTVVIATAVQTLTNKTMGSALNAGGYKITNLATPTDASDAVRKDFADAQVAAAATSAASAAISATSAAASATTAAASVATIAGYATASANSASAAATSAASAATSATSAAASAASMAGSVAAAATSAASASASATAAATSATSAATSATSAAASATSAAASVVTIASYAAAAATSEANALTSANSAATSAASAAASTSAAAASATAAATSAASAATSASSAATTYDEFDDRYLGSKSTPPTTDNDGNALIEGALYWNSVDNAMYAWTGTEWGSISSTAAIYRYRYTASGGETSESGPDDNGVTMSYLPGKEQVYLNGVLLVRGEDYTASNGTSISSLSPALSSGDVLEIITFTAFDLATVIPNTIFDAKGDLIVASTADTPGKLAVGTDGYFLQASSTAALGITWAAVPTPEVTASNSVTLTNKTISGSTNTLTNIANASLTNSSITINGSPVSLGGSVTISSGVTTEQLEEVEQQVIMGALL